MSGLDQVASPPRSTVVDQSRHATDFRALFVTHRSHAGSAAGGVQTCTREYLRTLEAAGIAVEVIEIVHDTTLPTRLRRQLNSSPFIGPISETCLKAIANCINESGARLLLLNQVALAGAMPALRALETRETIKVALSHGCEITDLLHLARLKRALPLSGKLRPSGKQALSNVLMDEIRARRSLDGVVAISPYDAATEAWLGTRSTTWLPRTTRPELLDWKPQQAFFGYVGTLDHAPNLEGLHEVLLALEKYPESSIRVRIVGGPHRVGNWLEARFSTVDYLGNLDDQALRAEASGWQAFVHPIFCQARGCSTKLATALAWGIPIVTTELGRRGYVWSAGGCIEANDPGDFVERMLQLRDGDFAQRTRSDVMAAATSGPDIVDVASRLRSFLDSVETSRLRSRA